MAPITLQRFVEELDKLKQEADAGTLKLQDYDGRLARMLRELRERGFDPDRAAATAALADALQRGVITAPVKEHLQNRLGLA
jgi:chemotaxis regulatin CheY-phosphate phosphatase CheZ